MPKKKPDMVEIHWVDAQTTGGAGWMDREEMRKEAKSKLPVMYSLGFIVYEDENQIALVCMYGPNESSQVHKVPKSMIVYRKDIGNDG